MLHVAHRLPRQHHQGVAFLGAQHLDAHRREFGKGKIHELLDQQRAFKGFNDREAALHHRLGFFGFQHAAVHAVKHVVIERVLFGRFHAQFFEIVMHQAFPDDHEPAAHGNAVRAQRQRRREAPSVVKSACGNQGHLHHRSDDGDQHHRRGRRAVRRRFVAGDHQRVAAELYGLGRVFGDGDRPHHLAAVGVHVVHKPGFAQRIVDHGNFFFNGDGDIFLCPRPHENLVDAEGLVRKIPDPADVFARFLWVAARDGQNPQTSGIADGRNQLGFRNPVHPGQHDGMVNAEHLRHSCFEHKIFLRRRIFNLYLLCRRS